MPDPVARSPIRPAEPVIVSGWEVEGARSTAAPLTLADLSSLAKTLVRAPARGVMAVALGVSFARAARDASGALVTGSGPGEWTIFGPLGEAASQRTRLEAVAAAALAAGELVTVLDLTHGRALIRLTGAAAADLLAKVCAIDLADSRTPNGTALRTSVAKLTTDLVRDDQEDVPSYLLHCERSYGQYLWEALRDAGTEFGTGADGFTDGVPAR